MNLRSFRCKWHLTFSNVLIYGQVLFFSLSGLLVLLLTKPVCYHKLQTRAVGRFFKLGMSSKSLLGRGTIQDPWLGSRQTMQNMVVDQKSVAQKSVGQRTNRSKAVVSVMVSFLTQRATRHKNPQHAVPATHRHAVGVSS